ncbi:hypothetical protein F4779DRAFT_17202 [Xylariaceae sp. FL0662B]|nr:hypothetical protein F4779DRAFT_461103 [Xylariaceae sp. FL0662B]KAI0012659.1 hypothetical protein F4779DRAFT_17202 [Xylariaceae sp. FL0662B]
MAPRTDKGKGVATRSETARDTEEPASVPTMAGESTTAMGDSALDPILAEAERLAQSEGIQNNLRLDNELQSIRERIQTLEAIKAARADLDRLMAEAGLKDTSKPAKRRRSASSSSDSSSGPDLKTENILMFKMDWTFRRREEWLGDLDLAYKRAPKKLRSVPKRILYALDQMEAEARSQWKRHIHEMPSQEERDAAYEDYPGFVEWTLTLLKDADNKEFRISQQIEDSTQNERQSPRDWDIYLDALERQVEPKSETARVTTFYTKLQPAFRFYLDKYGGEKPTTRPLMVSWAQTKWEAWSATGLKRRRANTESGTGNKYPRHPNDSNVPAGRTSDDAGTPSNPHNAQEGNPYGDDGNRLKCYHCNSEMHLANRCPKRPPPDAAVDSVERGSGYPRGRGRGGRFQGGWGKAPAL